MMRVVCLRVPRLLIQVLASLLASSTALEAREVTFQIQNMSGQRELPALCMLKETDSGKMIVPGKPNKGILQATPSFYAVGAFKVDLATDTQYLLSTQRGMFWPAATHTFVLGATSSVVVCRLKPHVDFYRTHWYSGDLGLRTSFQDTPILIGAADLHVGSVVRPATEAESSARSEERGIFHVPGQRAYSGCDWEFEDFNFLSAPRQLKESETPFNHTHLPLMKACREMGGMVDAVNLEGKEIPVAAALGWIDTARIVGPRREMNDCDTKEEVLKRFEAYYRYLNAGFKIPLSAGSLSTEPQGLVRAGDSRVYVRILGDFSAGTFFKGLKKGRSWATNGPGLSMTVAGGDPGKTVDAQPGKSLKVSIGARSPHALDQVEVIANGVVAATVPAAATSDFVLKDLQLNLDRGGWIAARVFEKPGGGGEPARYAHTSPVYVNAPGQSAIDREQVQEFVNRITQRISEVENDPAISEEEKAWILDWSGQARDKLLPLTQ
jgi:hypothetical protein